MKVKAQAVLETTLSMVAAFIILAGAVRVFAWVTKDAVDRQEQFQRERRATTGIPYLTQRFDYTPQDPQQFRILGSEKNDTTSPYTY